MQVNKDLAAGKQPLLVLTLFCVIGSMVMLALTFALPPLPDSLPQLFFVLR